MASGARRRQAAAAIAAPRQPAAEIARIPAGIPASQNTWR